MFPRDRAVTPFHYERGGAAEGNATKEQHLGSRNRHEYDRGDAAAVSKLCTGSPVESGVDRDVCENKNRLKQE